MVLFLLCFLLLQALHRRCIEQLYDDHGLDILDQLLETQNTSATLAVLHSRLNQKIEVLSVSRLSLHKTCSDIIANNYYRSLDYRSSSFKQLDAKRMAPKGSFDLFIEILVICNKYY
jgi:paired amphipathic helix protein Sin3a